jgi:hypothetical protein
METGGPPAGGEVPVKAEPVQAEGQSLVKTESGSFKLRIKPIMPIAPVAAAPLAEPVTPQQQPQAPVTPVSQPVAAQQGACE